MALFNRTQFSGKFFEGRVNTEYNVSYIRLVVRMGEMVPHQLYTVIIDRSNGIKAACVRSRAWVVKLKKTDSIGAHFDDTYLNSSIAKVQNVTIIGNKSVIATHSISIVTTIYGVSTPLIKYDTVGNITFQSFTPKTCFQYSSSLTFSPAHQLFPTAINMTIRLAYELYYGDNITVSLPGFTIHGNFSLGMGGLAMYTGYGKSKVVEVLAPSNNSWIAFWEEDQSTTLFTNSRLLLFPKHFIPAGAVVILVVPSAVGLSSLCGRESNYSGFHYSVRSQNPPFYLHENVPFMYTQAIGPGCSNLNLCSGHGYCDYCTASCICQDGFGSPADKLAVTPNDFPPDCSGYVCPFGVSLAAPPLTPGTNLSATLGRGMHRRSECSGSGLCDRSRGRCKCFEGFAGRACQRMVCPGKPACSGNGVCLTSNRLASTAEALPLQRNKSSTVEWYELSVDGPTWDAETTVACVCDSSWEVGLGANQTQQAEFFGPACEFRRCPGGDDPSTTGIDETDCFNKSTTIGGGLGLRGNRCHVDCSNRGVCDYRTGACKCFDGYFGSNCGLLRL